MHHGSSACCCAVLSHALSTATSGKWRVWSPVMFESSVLLDEPLIVCPGGLTNTQQSNHSPGTSSCPHCADEPGERNSGAFRSTVNGADAPMTSPASAVEVTCNKINNLCASSFKARTIWRTSCSCADTWCTRWCGLSFGCRRNQAHSLMHSSAGSACVLSQAKKLVSTVNVLVQQDRAVPKLRNVEVLLQKGRGHVGVGLL